MPVADAGVDQAAQVAGIGVPGHDREQRRIARDPRSSRAADPRAAIPAGPGLGGAVPGELRRDPVDPRRLHHRVPVQAPQVPETHMHERGDRGAALLRQQVPRTQQAGGSG
jgi:hypothetical protein